jgi:GTP cyclohydrolase I
VALEVVARRPSVDRPLLEHAARLILEAIGADPTRDDLRDTPRRFAGMWAELVEAEPFASTRFEEEEPNTTLDQMVLVDRVPLDSICAHHMAPFHCLATMAYIPRNWHLGLSKFARIARHAALGLHDQEHLAQDIALALSRATESPDVAVVLQGEHTCMSMRGARSPHRFTSSVMLGAFRVEPEARAEFFALSR